MKYGHIHSSMIAQSVWTLYRPACISPHIKCYLRYFPSNNLQVRYRHHSFKQTIYPQKQSLFNFRYSPSLLSSITSSSASSSPLPFLSSWGCVRHMTLHRNKDDQHRLVYLAYIRSLLQEFNELQTQHLAANEEGRITSQGNKRYQELMPVALKIQELFTKEKEQEELTALLSDTSIEDKELETIVKSEKDQNNETIQNLEDEIKHLLSASRGSFISDLVLEILPGVGGQESQLFAREMLGLYFNYAQYRGWDFTLVSEGLSDIGGVRKATAMISGDATTFDCMKFEGGVHRVQRIPKTERGGRIHTSTVTVAVLPQPKDIDIVLNPKDLEITTCRASGSGGQHVNTTDSAVRIVHLPTGMAAESQQERSQIKNKEIAMKILQTRLHQKQLQQQAQEIQSSRKTQVGTAGRSEKIRTYNFNQDRITDHRLSSNIHNLQQFFVDAHILDNLIENLLHKEREESLQQKLEEFSLLMKST
ncbi:peptide chain release factor 1-like, mitochondrial [Argonauta hians]